MTTITATPAKLRDGSWGARVTDPVKVDDTITIRTKAGKTWQAKVSKIVWGGSDAALVATESLDRPAKTQPAKGRCEDCGRTIPARYNLCRDCRDLLAEDMGDFSHLTGRRR